MKGGEKMLKSQLRNVPQAINSLNDLLVGMAKYSDEEELVAAIPTAVVLEKLNELKQLYYEQKNTLNESRIKARELKRKLAEISKYYSSRSRMARAILGPDDQRLVDLGLRPYKKRTKKRKNDQPTSPQIT
jgi:hypothetical protein